MSEPTLEQLKSRAYDLIALKEQVERELQQVNQAIQAHTDNSTTAKTSEPQDHKKKASKS